MSDPRSLCIILTWKQSQLLVRLTWTGLSDWTGVWQNFYLELECCPAQSYLWFNIVYPVYLYVNQNDTLDWIIKYSSWVSPITGTSVFVVSYYGGTLLSNFDLLRMDVHTQISLWNGTFFEGVWIPDRLTPPPPPHIWIIYFF